MCPIPGFELSRPGKFYLDGSQHRCVSGINDGFPCRLLGTRGLPVGKKSGVARMVDGIVEGTERNVEAEN